MTAGGQLYLCYFLHRHLDFRINEVKSILKLSGLQPSDYKILPPKGSTLFSPFWYVWLPHEQFAKFLGERSILIKGVFELWAEAHDWQQLQNQFHTQCDAVIKQKWTNSQVSFKIVVDGWGKKFNNEETLNMIEKLCFMGNTGPVHLSNPDAKFWLIISDTANTSGVPQGIPYTMYLGREIVVSCGGGGLLDKYRLNRRCYIGPTSMDPELAFIMCNQGQVKRGSLVLDPFVGTGSVLICAAHYGAYTMGGDIDIRVVRNGKMNEVGNKVDVWSNFQQYNLPQPLGLFRMDLHQHSFRKDISPIFDAIVCDPPYGVRAGGRKLQPKTYHIPHPETHFPHTDPYTLAECIRDLLDISARLLKVGGRLVFWVPSSPDTPAQDELPQHPSMLLVCYSEQFLTTKYSRLLLTMEKVKELDLYEVEEFYSTVGPPSMKIDKVSDIVFSNKNLQKQTFDLKCRGKRH